MADSQPDTEAPKIEKYFFKSLSLNITLRLLQLLSPSSLLKDDPPLAALDEWPGLSHAKFEPLDENLFD